MDRDEIRADLIRMRKYILHHGVMINECSAWNRLKKEFGVGQSTNEDDELWLNDYEKTKAAAKS